MTSSSTENMTNVCPMMTPYPRFNMSPGQRITLATYNIVVNGVVSLVLNLFIIGALQATKQTQITAMKLVLFISSADVLGAASVSVLITLLLVKFPTTCQRDVELTTLFFLVLSGHSSCYGTALTAYDRYARVRLASRYKAVMSAKKIQIVLLCTFVLALFVSLLFVAGNLYGFSGMANMVVLTIDTVVMVSIIVCYIKFNRGINKVGERVAQSSCAPSSRRATDRSIVAYVKRVLLALAIIYFAYFLTVLVTTMLYSNAEGSNRGWLEVLKMSGIFLVHTNSAINAVIFIKGNKKCKQLVRKRPSSWKLALPSFNKQDEQTTSETNN